MWGRLETDAVTRPGYLAGFATLESEVEIDSLPIEGEIPDWLDGTLLRNGPGKFELGDDPLLHWCDGLAMLHRFSFAGGEVSYANRFLRSEAFRAVEHEERSFGAFGTEEPRSILKRATGMFKPALADNCSFHVVRLGDEFVAITETPVPVAFDPRTLKTHGIPCGFPGQHFTAHPHHDAERGEMLGLATQFGPRSKYVVFAQVDSSGHRVVAELPAGGEPSYMHSFAVTERHILLTACPFVVNPVQLGLSGKPFIENFRWLPEAGVRFYVLDRGSGELRRTYETDTFFAFHHVNAFERGSELVVDLIVYESPEVIDALYLDELRASPPSEAVHGSLRRQRIDLAGGRVLDEELSGKMFELPQIDYDGRNGRPYRYVYGAAVDTDTGGEPADFLDQLIKIDVESGETRVWFEPGAYPGEAVFVPAPRPGRREDEGVLLSVVLDSRGTGSYLLVLDAESLEELGRARVPHHIPFGFHGQYFAGRL
jgi:beta,beta-carotene 9',10'-dioxygenase